MKSVSGQRVKAALLTACFLESPSSSAACAGDTANCMARVDEPSWSSYLCNPCCVQVSRLDISSETGLSQIQN